MGTEGIQIQNYSVDKLPQKSGEEVCFDINTMLMVALDEKEYEVSSDNGITKVIKK